MNRRQLYLEWLATVYHWNRIDFCQPTFIPAFMAPIQSDKHSVIAGSQRAREKLKTLSANASRPWFLWQKSKRIRLVLADLYLYCAKTQCLTEQQLDAECQKEIAEWRNLLNNPHCKMLLDSIHNEVHRRWARTFEQYSLFPQERWLRPTRSGNVTAALDDYAKQRYEIDTATLWGRLWWVLPEHVKAEIREARLAVEALLNICVAVALLGGMIVVYMFIYSDRTDLADVGVVAALILAAAVIAWNGRRSAMTLKDKVESAVDVYRLRLLEDLGFKPRSVGEERDLFAEHQKFFTQAVKRQGGRLYESAGASTLAWEVVQNNLGNVLATLGKRNNETERLKQAVCAYQAALTSWARDRLPLEWAMAQSNLGDALLTLGQRERGTERLREAVGAYRAAAQEITRERLPHYWARIEGRLGDALRELGERETGTVKLEEAVEAYRGASEVWSAEQEVLKLASVQNNLGRTFFRLSLRLDDPTRYLEKATAAYREALEVWAREREPLDWAETQNNLGNALQMLGKRGCNPTTLEQAIDAYEAALTIRTREHHPLLWALTQEGVGLARAELGASRHDGVAARQGVTAILREFWINAKSRNRVGRRAKLRGLMWRTLAFHRTCPPLPEGVLFS